METTLPPTVPASAPSAAALPPVGQLLKESWAVYKQRFWTLIGISLIPYVILLVSGLVAGGGFALFRYSGLTYSTSPLPLGTFGIILGIILFVALVGFGVWSEAAVLWNLNNSAGDPGFKASFKNSQAFIGTLFFVNLLVGLAVLGGLILLIIPGIIFGLWFSQSSYVVVVEHLEGTSALKRSKAYVQGRLGAVFWRFLVIGVIVWAISFIITLIGSAISKPAGPLLNNFVSFIIGPWVAAYGFALYYHLKATRPS